MRLSLSRPVTLFLSTMAASSPAASKLMNIRASLLPALIRRHLLRPSAAASNLTPSSSNQSINLFLRQNGLGRSSLHSSSAYLPQLQFRSSLIQIRAARTYVTKDDRDYVNPDGVEDYDDDEDDDEEDLENYSGSDFDDEDEYEDPDAK